MHSIRLLYDELLKPFSESNRARSCPATERLFVVNVKMGPYIHWCILRTQKTLYVVIHSHRDCPTHTEDTHACPGSPPEPGIDTF